MVDIGQYHIVKQDGKYIVTEMLSGKERDFVTVVDMCEWIEQDILDVDVEDED
jgi:hypothetical protein